MGTPSDCPTLNLIGITQFTLPRFQPPEVQGAQWVGNSTRRAPAQALLDYQGLKQWQLCRRCLFARPFHVAADGGDILWAVYSEIKDGPRENGVYL